MSRPGSPPRPDATGREGSRTRRRVGDDGTTALTGYVVLLLAIPSVYVIGPLGAAGAPAQVVAMALVLWWVGQGLARQYVPDPRRHPVRVAMLLFVAVVGVAYVVANLRPIDGAEARAADRGMLAVLGLLGVVLVADDRIPSRERLDVLLRRVVLAGAAVATLGLAQFWTGLSFVEYLRLPGLTDNGGGFGVAERAGFLRPAGTAAHPIEFGVAIAMLFPLALHYALTDEHRGRLVRWYPVAATALAIPVSVSRSAVLCLALALLLMLPAMSRRARGLAVVGGVAMVGVVYVAVPGMLGAILGLFTRIGVDTSAASRTDSYGLAAEFIARAPVFGRGLATFLPEYRILDNQYLLITIELGVVGLAALLGLVVTGVVVARRVRRRAPDAATGQLAQALLASLVAGAASFALFDAFAFPKAAGLTFLVLGLIGGLDRLVPPRPVARPSPG
ncbi:MAG: O-antigen ligase family protein [Kineosporiaceae bacterium]